MKKTALIFGICSFFLFLVLTVILACLTPCLALLLGGGAGWLAAYWTKPRDPNSAAITGAQAGALSGIGALLGQAVGGLVQSQFVTPDMLAQVTEFYESLGFEGVTVPLDSTFFGTLIGGQACCGLLNLGLMAGLGALAAFLHFRYSDGRTISAADTYNGYDY
jgi:hypothetical protein